MIKKLLALSLIIFSVLQLSSQGVTGKWKTIDDETGEAKSVVEIFESDGKIYGKIVKILKSSSPNPVCNKCEGENYKKPILGMQIIDGLEQDDDVYEGGTILNPSNGKVYKCRLKIEDDPDTLQVRGYVAFFYKTQYWQRVK